MILIALKIYWLRKFEFLRLCFGFLGLEFRGRMSDAGLLALDFGLSISGYVCVKLWFAEMYVIFFTL